MTKRPIAITRWILAAVLFGVAFWLVKSGAHSGAATLFIYGFGAALVGVVALSPELVELASLPVPPKIAGFFWPGGTLVSQEEYVLARKYREEWRYAESINQYRLIAWHHPQELAAYLESIETAFEARAPEMATKLYLTGLRRLSSLEDRAEVKRVFGILTQRHQEIATRRPAAN